MLYVIIMLLGLSLSLIFGTMLSSVWWVFKAPLLLGTSHCGYRGGGNFFDGYL